MTSFKFDKAPTADVDALRAWMRDEFAKLHVRLVAQDRRLDMIQDAADSQFTEGMGGLL
jgi:hypothetical protein